MVRYGKNVKAAEINMVIVLFPLVIVVITLLLAHYQCQVTNFRGDEITYSLGVAILFGVLFFIVNYTELNLHTSIYLYLAVLWVTGFIDDRYGTKYPKGIKGHLRYFFRKGIISTGLMKLVATNIAAIGVVFYHHVSFRNTIPAFFLLIITPHIMNLFDTRPLRVWKLLVIHLLVLLPLLVGLSLRTFGALLLIVAPIVFFEGRKWAMLGDNGATLIGGIVGTIITFTVPLLFQWLVIISYFFIVIITERYSITKWIESRPILRKIDQWGVS